MFKNKVIKLFLIFGVIIFSLVGICGCKKNENKNDFYTLQEAYTKNLLTVEDLKNIASYHNNGKQVENNLNEEVINEIKKIAAYKVQNDELNPVIDAKAEDFIITKYYGTYNKSVVFMINNPYFESPAEDLGIIESIANIDFYYSSTDRIWVWHS